MVGWICSHRSIWKQPFFKGHGMRVAVWHWLLHHAAWEPVDHTVGSATITLNRGEVCFSQQQICDDTGATRKQVRDVLDYLVERKKGTKIGANERAKGGAKVGANSRSVLIIEKYDEYQEARKVGAKVGAKGGAAKGPTKEQVNKKQEANASLDGEVSKILAQVCFLSMAENFVSFRRELGKPMTERSARAMVTLLHGHHDPDAVLNNSISNGWQGIFPEKITNGGHNGQRNHNGQNQTYTRGDAQFDEARERALRIASRPAEPGFDSF
tara:strand:+ start:826 stop:1632 length:807 start_codon:yes stop_codon:yes gene_type:complete